MTTQADKEANTFAFAFLMPEKKVREIYRKEHGDLASIANWFKVPLSIAEQRLRHLGHAEQEKEKAE